MLKAYLSGDETPEEYLDRLAEEAGRYSGFSLIIGNVRKLYWYSNQGDGAHLLTPGQYALSNGLLDSPWPKLLRSKEAMARILSQPGDPDPETLFRALGDRSVPDDKNLPDTGVGLEWERILSPIFVTSPIYGTRSSTVFYVDRNNNATFMERTFDSDPDKATTLKYGFQITP